MTVIVGARTKKDGIVFAADSQVSWGYWQKQDGYDQKLWADDDKGYIIGGCGSVREMQAVQWHVEWPRPSREEGKIPLMKFAVTELVPAIVQGLSGRGVLKEKHARETLDSAFLIAWEDNILCIDGDFSVSPAANGRMAIGSGYAEAYGSLGDKGVWTRAEIIKAARRATLTAQGVGGSIYTISTVNPVVELALTL